MNKIKIFFIILFSLILTSSIGCSIYYGISYSDLKKQEQEDNSGVLTEIERLRKEINELTFDIASLNSEKVSLELTIETLKEKDEVSQETINNLQEEIKILNSQILDLNNQIKYYQELLEAYEQKDKLIVTFKVQENIYDVQLINLGEYVNIDLISDPEIQGYKFLGWAIGEEIITDWTTYSITQDVTITAVLEQKPTSEVLFDANTSGGYRNIEGQDLKSLVQFDLNSYFDFDLTDKQIEITFQYYLITDAGPACAPSSDVILSSGESIQCIRNNEELWASISLEGSILTIVNEGYVSTINDLTIEISKLVVYYNY